MSRRIYLAVLALALLPSLWLAWYWQKMPQLGVYHDDAIYLVGAKSLAEGNGYRIESQPAAPAQTKYPPLYPAMLAVIWKLAPAFPANLPWFAWFAWIWLPAAVWLAVTLYRDSGFAEWQSAALGAFLAISPVTVMFSSLLMTELPFLTLLLGSILLADRGRPAAAGLMGGVAFLTRTAGLPLLFSAPLVFGLKKEWKSAARFVAGMLPQVVAWQWWSAANRTRALEQSQLFYTDYLEFWRLDMQTQELPDVVWMNFASMVKAIGELVVFNEDVTFGTLTVARLLTVGAIAGLARLAASGRFHHYSAFGILYLGQFLIWNYPPNSRFLLPLLPLIAAGIWREASNLAGIVQLSWRKRKTGDRIAAVAVSGLMAWLAFAIADRAWFGNTKFLPGAFGYHAEVLEANRDVYSWLQANVPEDAGILAYSDPVVYLHTGRKGFSMRVPPGLLKRGDKSEIGRFFGRVPEVAMRLRGRYVLLTRSDYHMDAPDLTAPEFRRAVTSGERFQPVYEDGDIRVLRLVD